MAKDIKVTLELDNRQFNRSINESKRQVGSFEKSSTSSLGNIKNAFLAIGGAAIVQQIFDIGQSFQDLRSSLNFVVGSVEEGSAAFDNLTQLATVTQFGVEELVQSFIRLKGAGIEPTNDLLLTFADTASIAQDEIGVLNALTELFARAASKGKLELTDFDKVAERGIDIYGALRKEFGMNIDEIQKLAKTADGQKRLFKGIEKALDDSFGGALQLKLKNSRLAFSNLRIAVRSLSDAIFTELGLGSTDAINSLTAAINRLADNGDLLRKTFIGIVTVASFIFNPFSKILGVVGFLSKGFVGLFKGMGPIRKVFRQVTTNAGNFFSVLKSRAMSFLGFGTNTAKNSTVLKGLNETVEQGTKRFLAYGSAVGGAIVATKAMKQESEDFVGPPKPPEITPDVDPNAVNEIELVKDKVQEYLDTLKNKLVNLANFNAAMAEVEAKFGSDKTVEGVENYKRAVRGVEEAFEDVVIPMQEAKEEAEELAEEQRELQIQLDQGRDAIKKFTDSFTSQLLTTEELSEKQSELNALLSKYPELANLIADAQDRLNQAFTENEGINNFLDTLARAQKSLSEDLANALLEGEKPLEAFKDFFKKIVQQILADIIRLSIIQPILGSILAPFGLGFGTGGSIVKKAVGGPVMANRPYIVGERGPEMFVPNTAGSIMRNDQLGMGGAVTYNINAVDARSFQQLVASDPEFIFSVTEAGRRRIPGRF